jgi:hypothetical protein
VQALQSLHLDNLGQQQIGQQRLASLHLTNEKVRAQFLGDFDKAKKHHLDHTGGSAAGGKKKALTAKERAAMIAKMQVHPCHNEPRQLSAPKRCWPNRRNLQSSRADRPLDSTITPGVD